MKGTVIPRYDSHAQTLVPILVAKQAPALAIAALHQRQTPPTIDAQAWEASGYQKPGSEHNFL